MHRINTAHADPNANGPGKAGFKDGTPPSEVPTRLNASFFNALQEEIANVVEEAGLTLDENDKTQLRQAVLTLISANTAPTDQAVFESNRAERVAQALGGAWTTIGGAAATSIVGLAACAARQRQLGFYSLQAYTPLIAACKTDKVYVGDLQGGWLDAGSW